jgi:hypothetical protein
MGFARLQILREETLPTSPGVTLIGRLVRLRLVALSPERWFKLFLKEVYGITSDESRILRCYELGRTSAHLDQWHRAEANMNSTTPLRLHIGRSQFRGDRTIEFTLRTCRRTALQIDCVCRFAQDSISIDVWSHLMHGIASMASRG